MKEWNKTEDLDQIIQECSATIRPNTYPWVFLACTNCDEDILLKTTNVFNLKSKKVNNQYFLYSKVITQNHKEKALQLLFAALYVTHLSPKIACCIGQLNVLNEVLHQTHLPPQDIVISETCSSDFQVWKPLAGSIYVGMDIRIYFEQVGLDIQSDVLNSKEWTEKLLALNSRPLNFNKVG